MASSFSTDLFNQLSDDSPAPATQAFNDDRYEGYDPRLPFNHFDSFSNFAESESIVDSAVGVSASRRSTSRASPSYMAADVRLPMAAVSEAAEEEVKSRGDWRGRSQIPIEIIRQQVDEAEIRVNQLLARRPERMTRRNDACTDSHLDERVAIPNPNQNHPRPEGVTVPHSSDHAGVLQLPGGNPPKMTGNSPPLSSLGTKGISISTPRAHSDLIRNDGVDWTFLPKMHVSPESSSSPSPSLSTNRTQPYFVTEPDSPKSSKSGLSTGIISPNTTQPPIFDSITPSNPTHKPTSNSIPVTTTHTIPSPSKPILTQYLDVSLANVFKSLAIKRKACEDVETSERSKILRLCAPEPPTKPPNPTLKTKTTRSSHKPYRGGRSSGSARNSTGAHEIAQAIDIDLRNVSVQQQFGSLDGESDLVLLRLLVAIVGPAPGFSGWFLSWRSPFVLNGEEFFATFGVRSSSPAGPVSSS
ncbi:hypothetical protein RHGRI_037432 [Rhododendron griersonianum]|uniref:Uncharacterized protein n=1 Tax=Rhododendron griersonianum TaxID=479676 RepID=A0AAV6HSR6_9ERIC|nr:hypothetical protein RHGRI_037432 [Rhododendron griersonianum]